MDVECSVLSWHSGGAGTGGTIWPIYSRGSKSSEEHKRPHFRRALPSENVLKASSHRVHQLPAGRGNTLSPAAVVGSLFAFPLNIEKNCIVHQKHEKNIYVLAVENISGGCGVRGFKKPVSAHRGLGKWPQTLFDLIFSALAPLSKLTYFFSFFFYLFFPLVFSISSFKV